MLRRYVRLENLTGAGVAAVLAAILVSLGAAGYRGESGARGLDAMEFPDLPATSDVDDILGDYPAYLKFVLEVGRDVNPKLATRLDQTYTKLRRRDPEGAARFLRGLRFEMIQKLEMTGMSPRSVSTRHPAMRRWVAKFLPAWHREADEYLFRSFSNPLVRR